MCSSPAALMVHRLIRLLFKDGLIIEILFCVLLFLRAGSPLQEAGGDLKSLFCCCGCSVGAASSFSSSILQLLEIFSFKLHPGKVCNRILHELQHLEGLCNSRGFACVVRVCCRSSTRYCASSSLYTFAKTGSEKFRLPVLLFSFIHGGPEAW